MFDIGGPELIVIVLFILILFGPKKIPEFAQMVGKGMQKIKQAQAQFQSQINDIQSELTVPDIVPESKLKTDTELSKEIIENDYGYDDLYKNATPSIQDESAIPIDPIVLDQTVESPATDNIEKVVRGANAKK
jgi:TatA/E family protein of Tat protein translocase